MLQNNDAIQDKICTVCVYRNELLLKIAAQMKIYIIFCFEFVIRIHIWTPYRIQGRPNTEIYTIDSTITPYSQNHKNIDTAPILLTTMLR